MEAPANRQVVLCCLRAAQRPDHAQLPAHTVVGLVDAAQMGDTDSTPIVEGHEQQLQQQ